MHRVRWIKAACVFLLVSCPVLLTLMLGIYYRSPLFRNYVTSELEAFFDLPLDITSVRPHGFRSLQLIDVDLWLSDRRDRILHCPRVIWKLPDARQADGWLQIESAAFRVGSDQWQKSDYTHVAASVLRHDFRAFGIREMRFENASILWPNNEFLLRASDVNARIRFDDQGQGQFILQCPRLNEVGLDQPIQVTGKTTPASEIFVPQTTLSVPRLPLKALAALLPIGDNNISAGVFDGEMTVVQTASHPKYHLTGRIEDVDLAEWPQLPDVPALTGRASVSLERCEIADQQLQHLEIRGELLDCQPDSLLVLGGVPPAGGLADVRLHSLEFHEGRINHLHMTAGWEDFQLRDLVHHLTAGPTLTAAADLSINSLVIRNHQIATGDILIDASPPPGETRTLPKSLLERVLIQELGLNIPARIIPRQVAYSRLGCRALVDQQNIRLLGLNNPTGQAMITLRLMGRDWPLLENRVLTFTTDQLNRQIDRLFTAAETAIQAYSSRRPALPRQDSR